MLLLGEFYMLEIRGDIYIKFFIYVIYVLWLFECDFLIWLIVFSLYGKYDKYKFF